ncbi:MAG: hypothetical protein SPL61_13625 [Saccharofermentans sp.]|nr:hypothetical protein [Saccharofermentans sp.]
MKGFTKTIAAFCAMAMIFGMFSATVFADESDVAGENVASGEAVDGAQQEEGSDPEDSDDKDSKKADKEAEKAEKDALKEADKAEKEAEKAEKEALKEAEKEAKQEAKLLGAGQGQSGDQAGTQAGTQAGDQAGEQPSTATEQGNGTDTVESVPDPAPVNANSLFANGLITQDDINSNNGELPETSGSYKLAGNVYVSNSSHIDAAGTQITIDLNGYTITYTGDENLYTIGKVDDVEIDGQQRVVVHGNITLRIKDSGNGGKITASNSTRGAIDHWISINNGNPQHGTEGRRRGGCILVQNSCTFILDGGEINGFHSESDGAAIHVSNGGTCVINGGKITDCICDSIQPRDDGGAVSCHCTSKGTQVGNIYYISEEDQDPVKTTLSLKGKLTINGGTISNCSGSQGGAIRVLRADIELNGGTITGNSAKNGGGAILYTKGNSGSFKISGNPVISGNTCNDAKKANLCFADNGTAVLSGNLSSDAKIEFGGNSTTANFFDINGKSYSLKSFVSNHAGYSAYVSGNYIKLTNAVLPKIEGYQLLIGGEIKIRAFMSLADYADSNTTVNYAYSYTKGSNTVNVAKTVNFSNLGTSGSYYTVDMPVESACITSPITVTINYGSGEQASDDPVTIEKYIKAVLDGDYPTEAKYVADALHTFGAVAMLQFNINTNDPALKPASWEIDVNLYDPAQAPKYEIGEGSAYTPANDPDGAFYGASVNFLSKTEVNLYFKKSVLGDTAPSMTVTYAGNETETVSATVNGSYYVYTVKGPTGDGFAATLFDVPFSFSVGNVSGEYSIDTYLQVIEYKYHGQSNNVLLLLVEKYYDFAKKCQQL